MTPLYYDLVPKDPIQNLKWRIYCRERALKDKRFRDAFWQACMDDVCFWMGACCWGYDPRANLKIVPFIPYPHQEQVFQALDQAIEDSTREGRTIDVVLDKARAQGGTFGYLWVDLRRWLRDKMFSAGYVTRNESLVDSKTDSNTVLWKIQWAIDMLPVWMQPKYERNLAQHTFWNKDNGALLRGYAAGQDVAAGGRATIFTCLAAGTLVVTDHGAIPIESVRLHHLVWDGTMWVKHGGCVYQGRRETISAYGIRLTPDHQVLTQAGWSNASDRLDREEIRLPHGYSARWLSHAWREKGQCEMALPLRLWAGAICGWIKTAKRGAPKLRLQKKEAHFGGLNVARNDTNSDVQLVVWNGPAMHKSESSTISPVRRSRNQGLRKMDDLRELFEGHGDEARKQNTGSHRQQQWIYDVELPVGKPATAGKQYLQQHADRHRRSEGNGCGSSKGCESDSWCDSLQIQARSSGISVVSSSCTRTEPVYDIKNCGPKKAFTIIDKYGKPLLVHNCDEFGAKDFIAGGKDAAVMEALHDVSNCVRLVSARYADSGVFHEACENPDTRKSGVYLVLDWKDHPVHGKNSYIVQNGKPVARKPEEAEAVAKYHAENPDLRARLERKGFKWEGVVRSPWYDMRCVRPTATPRLIASQLDRNPRGAVGKCFPTDLLDRMKRECCKQPVWQGQPVFDSETLTLTGLIKRDDGPLKLWFKPGIDNSPPLGPFTLGCDIALGGDGSYSSNSVASGLDNRTGEQALEYTIKGMDPIKFADVTVGLAKWLRNALLGWEDSGMSGGFAKQIMEVRYYGNVFFRNVTQLGSQKKSRKPGWPCRDNDKAEMFEKLSIAMDTGKYIPRSEAMIVECGEYEWDDGKIVHTPTKNRGAADKNHGDRCIAGGGCWTIFSTDNAETRIDSDTETGQIPEYGSFLWREQRERRSSRSGATGFGIVDLIGQR